MKSILLGFLAAVIGCIIFFLCLAGWYELTGQGSGVAGRASSGEGTVVVVTQEIAGQDSAGSETATQGTGSGSVTQGSGSVSQGTGSGSASQGSGSASQGYGSVSQGSGSGTGSGTTGNTGAGSGSSSATAQTPGSVADKAINDFMETIERELTQSLDDSSHVTVARSSRGITITLWEDGLVTKLSDGQKDKTTESMWNEKKEQLKQITSSYAGRSAAAGVTNTHVIANLLNERNQSDIILSYEDGMLIHDGLDHD